MDPKVLDAGSIERPNEAFLGIVQRSPCQFPREQIIVRFGQSIQ
jgi:hypothetical protein